VVNADTPEALEHFELDRSGDLDRRRGIEPGEALDHPAVALARTPIGHGDLPRDQGSFVVPQRRVASLA
jgi:hypothetical protein